MRFGNSFSPLTRWRNLRHTRTAALFCRLAHDRLPAQVFAKERSSRAYNAAFADDRHKTAGA